jgi:transcriptional regulator with XRE-family HTH domain
MVIILASSCHMNKATSLSPARKILALNLRKLRGQRALSQEALADAAGLHRTYVSSIERSERNVSIDNIERLARALNVTPASLLEESNG